MALKVMMAGLDRYGDDAAGISYKDLPEGVTSFKKANGKLNKELVNELCSDPDAEEDEGEQDVFGGFEAQVSTNGLSVHLSGEESDILLVILP